MLVVGSIMGQVGVVTWNGYDTRQAGQNKEGTHYNQWRGQFNIFSFSQPPLPKKLEKKNVHNLFYRHETFKIRL